MDNVIKKFNVDKFQNTKVIQNFKKKLLDKLLQSLPSSVEDDWDKLNNAIITSGIHTLWFKTKKHQEWFDNNDKELQHPSFHQFAEGPNVCNKKGDNTNRKTQKVREQLEPERAMVERKSNRNPTSRRFPWHQWLFQHKKLLSKVRVLQHYLSPNTDINVKQKVHFEKLLYWIKLSLLMETSRTAFQGTRLMSLLMKYLHLMKSVK